MPMEPKTGKQSGPRAPAQRNGARAVAAQAFTGKLESIRPALRELERALDWSAKRHGGLPYDVTVTIQTRGKKSHCAGWHESEQWVAKDGRKVSEIRVSAEDLLNDPIDMIGTMVEANVHMFARSQDIRDVTKSGYHNRRFARLAESFGLATRLPADSRGVTASVSVSLRRQIESSFKPDLDAFNLARVAILAAPKKQATKMLKWRCTCTTVRCAVKLVATCGSCGKDFAQVS